MYVQPTSVYLEHATIAGTALVQSSVLKSWRRKFLIVKHHYLYIFQVDTVSLETGCVRDCLTDVCVCVCVFLLKDLVYMGFFSHADLQDSRSLVCVCP